MKNGAEVVVVLVAADVNGSQRWVTFYIKINWISSGGMLMHLLSGSFAGQAAITVQRANKLNMISIRRVDSICTS